jgi:hypothetical protein
MSTEGGTPSDLVEYSWYVNLTLGAGLLIMLAFQVYLLYIRDEQLVEQQEDAQK